MGAQFRQCLDAVAGLELTAWCDASSQVGGDAQVLRLCHSDAPDSTDRVNLYTHTLPSHLTSANPGDNLNTQSKYPYSDTVCLRGNSYARVGSYMA